MAWSRTYDEAEPQRVNRWLAQSGVCSRREAEALIAAGQVFIDGQKVEDPGRKIVQGQTLTLNDQAQARLEGQLTVILNKPVGYVSAQPEAGQIPAARLLGARTLFGESDDIPGPERRLAPIGRLDQDSRGLLLLSEDGVLTKAVIGPEADMEKEYLVRVRGDVGEPVLARLRHGLELDGRQLKPAKVTLAGDQRLRFILREGRNRQIRRMCDLVGLSVIDLYRLRIGPLKLGDLPEGRWRPITAAERAALLRGDAPRPSTRRPPRPRRP